jgi:response regulator RpfG family c-di-GMP phosphodiesterase
METVLVIEHHPASLVAQAMILRCFGYTVLEAEDDGEADRACHQYTDPIHLLVIGTTAAPSRDGELARRLQSLRPEMRALFLSSFSSSGAAGEELQKPIGADSLVRTIRELLNGAPLF